MPIPFCIAAIISLAGIRGRLLLLSYSPSSPHTPSTRPSPTSSTISSSSPTNNNLSKLVPSSPRLRTMERATGILPLCPSIRLSCPSHATSSCRNFCARWLVSAASSRVANSYALWSRCIQRSTSHSWDSQAHMLCTKRQYGTLTREGCTSSSRIKPTRPFSSFITYSRLHTGRNRPLSCYWA